METDPVSLRPVSIGRWRVTPRQVLIPEKATFYIRIEPPPHRRIDAVTGHRDVAAHWLKLPTGAEFLEETP